MTNKQEVVGGERGMKQSKLLPSPGHNDSSFDNSFLHVKQHHYVSGDILVAD